MKVGDSLSNFSDFRKSRFMYRIFFLFEIFQWRHVSIWFVSKKHKSIIWNWSFVVLFVLFACASLTAAKYIEFDKISDTETLAAATEYILNEFYVPRTHTIYIFLSGHHNPARHNGSESDITTDTLKRITNQITYTIDLAIDSSEQLGNIRNTRFYNLFFVGDYTDFG